MLNEKNSKSVILRKQVLGSFYDMQVFNFKENNLIYCLGKPT